MSFPMLEPLEDRIAPAVIVNPGNHKVATYTDADGDTVTIRVTKGDLLDATFVTAASGVGEQLQRIVLPAGQGFDGTGISITAKRGPDGNGLVHVGAIDATNVDLGAVLVRGDLGQIDSGDATTRTAGIKALTVASLGEYGTSTQNAGMNPSNISTIKGGIPLLKVGGNLRGGSVVLDAG